MVTCRKAECVVNEAGQMQGYVFTFNLHVLPTSRSVGALFVNFPFPYFVLYMLL
jgi:hypothetical protein